MDRASRRATFLRLAAPDIGDAEIEEMVGAIRSGWVTTGPRVARFERELAERAGAPFVRCTSSCDSSSSSAISSTVGSRPSSCNNVLDRLPMR